MNKKTKVLLKENNEFEKDNLSERSKNVMTDIVCYLRGSDLSEYNQEIVRRDINCMISDGEKRGETPELVVGTEYQEFCDEIIKSFPKRTMGEKVIEYVNTLTVSVSVIAFIWLIGKVIQAMMSGTSVFFLHISMGEIVGNVIAVIEAELAFKHITHRVFLESYQVKSEFKKFLCLWLELMVLIIIPMCFYVLLNSPTFLVSLPVAVGFIVLPLLLGYILDLVD